MSFGRLDGEMELAISDIEALGEKLRRLTLRVAQLEKLHPLPYPEYCHRLPQCANHSSCPRDPSCID